MNVAAILRHLKNLKSLGQSRYINPTTGRPWPNYLPDHDPVVYREGWAGNPSGLTKRELFAAMAMQGLQRDGVLHDWGNTLVAEAAVKQADALLTELAKGETNGK